MSKHRCTHNHIAALSRRDFFKSSAMGLAAGVIGDVMGIESFVSKNAEAATFPALESPASQKDVPNIAARRPIVLRNGIVISMDPAVGNFVKADLLIQGKKIMD